MNPTNDLINLPKPPEGFMVHRTGTADEHLGGTNGGKTHIVFIRNDGNSMRTLCGRDGWMADNFRVRVRPWIDEDICGRCFKAMKKANP